jgi:hypothetical protein
MMMEIPKSIPNFNGYIKKGCTGLIIHQAENSTPTF